ncbi:hypothetical protein C6496_19195 [Candidatus Poribacteria bacterium]|nr:MAG: hypothetical protein C6496_19195 [Candidatus Poribacteria bacterium]
MILRRENGMAEETLLNQNHDLPLINEDVFNNLISRLVQAFQPGDYQNAKNRFGNETIELPSQWRRYKKVELTQLNFCVETSLFVWIQGLLLKYAVDMGLVKTSLFERQCIPGQEVGAEFDRLSNIFPRDSFDGGLYSWWWRGDNCVASDVWNLVKTSLLLSEIENLDGNSVSDLYMTYFPPKLRKSLGEFYTDRRIVEYILDWVGYRPQRNSNAENFLFLQNLIDPACGAGTFLISALERYFQDFLIHHKWISDGISDLVEHNRIIGVDINPFACTLSRLGYLIFLIPYLVQAKLEQGRLPLIGHLPIIQDDSLIDGHAKIRDETYDCVVGNPPYVRIQKLNTNGSKQTYRKSFDSAVGRFDLYSLFIERGLQLLKPNGKLGYITSNKFMTTNAGQGIREVISKRATVNHLFDLSDTKVFGAAVLPCVIVLENCKSRNKTFPFGLLREINYDKNYQSVEDVFTHFRSHISKDFCQEQINLPSKLSRKASFEMRVIQSIQPTEDGGCWHFLSPEEKRVIAGIEANRPIRLGEVAEITSGLKTTADSVFIHPMTESFIEKNKLEKSLIYPFIQASNIKRWEVQWTGTKEKSDTYVLYPHLVKKDRVVAANLNDYPCVGTYLKSHYGKLSNRQYLIQAGRKWYEIWVHQKPEIFQRPFKIVTPDIKVRNTFALDTRGYMSGASCFAIFPKNQTRQESYYLLGLLNSELLDFYHKVKASTFIYAGRYRYWKSYLQNYPIINCHLGDSKLEAIWQEVESQISDVCDLRIQDRILACGVLPLSIPSGTCAKSVFRFALQNEIANEVEKILSASGEELPRLEARLNDLVYHLYQFNDSLRFVVKKT